MVTAAVWILTLAIVAGTGLGFWHLRGASRPPLIAGIAHGVVGMIGLGVLLITLRGPPRGVEYGVGSFGATAAALFVAAAVTGVVLLLLWRKPVLMAIHAGLAVTAYMLLLAWNSLG